MTSNREAERLLEDAGPTISISEAAQCFGIHRTTAYELAKRDELGVPVMRLGRTWRVPTAEVRRVLGLPAAGSAAAGAS